MKTETIKMLEKTQIKKLAPTTGCCGGTPLTNEAACCKLDEEKIAEGESGCGCSNPPNLKSGSGCC